MFVHHSLSHVFELHSSEELGTSTNRQTILFIYLEGTLKFVQKAPLSQ